MSNVEPSYYSVACPEVHSYPIHSICSFNDSPSQVYLEINEKIWRALQTGNVFVHCLAGVHRAASVVVSHFLWRYHMLGHTYLEKNIDAIYRLLKAVRPGVEPLSYIRYVSGFEASLLAQKKTEIKSGEDNL